MKPLAKSKYDGLSDEEIVALAQRADEGASDYLVKKYINFIRGKSRAYFLMGADRDDLMQEGLFGFFKAIRDYESNHDSTFRNFAEVCIIRQVLTAVKTATRQKHQPLNSYVSLNKPVFTEENERTLTDMLANLYMPDPEELFIDKENVVLMERTLKRLLSPYELEVISRYLDGESYQEIADSTNRSIKSIDNALQRVKRKLSEYLATPSTTPGQATNQ